MLWVQSLAEGPSRLLECDNRHRQLSAQAKVAAVSLVVLAASGQVRCPESSAAMSC